MTCEIGEDFLEDLLPFLDWALKNGVWDGRPISWKDADHFFNQTETNILKLWNSQNLQILANLAWVGSTPENRSLIEKEYQPLKLSSNGEIIQTGFGKSLSKFWKKHKKEIIIGTVAVAIITTIVVVSVCSGGAAGAGVAALAAGAENKKKDDSKKDSSPSTNEVSESETSGSNPSIYFGNNHLSFHDDGVTMKGKTLSYQELLHEKDRESLRQFLCPDIPQNEIKTGPLSYGSQFTIPFELDTQPENLTSYSQPEKPKTFPCIGGINGMCTKREEAQFHAKYLNHFLPSHQKVDWVYNKTNTIIGDLLEIFFFNSNGISPNTGKHLKKNWEKFHEEFSENPHKKYLQFCHSQGAFHVRNALLQSPKEIRDRVIVVAIAPGTVVPDDICFKSFNYASEKDFVPQGELYLNGATFVESDILMTPEERAIPLENYKQIIFLKPHPDAKGFDHDFQSPTFAEKFEFHTKDYYKRNGEYEGEHE